MGFYVISPGTCYVTILSSRESVSELTATERMDVFKSNK